jgi:hypothetical protein
MASKPRAMGINRGGDELSGDEWYTGKGCKMVEEVW